MSAIELTYGRGGDGKKACPSIHEHLILSGSSVGERKRRKEQKNTRNEGAGGEEGRVRGYLKDRTVTRTAGFLAKRSLTL